MTDGEQAVGFAEVAAPEHPMSNLLRMDRLPHIWCPGCGLGIAVNCFAAALDKAGLDLDKVAVVSGIGCTGRVAGYVRLDSFHTTHGRAIPFATGLKLARPDLTVVVFSGDGDLVAIGGNHLIHAARRNVDITVVCVNNLNYGMTGGQVGPTTPVGAYTTTSPYGCYESPFSVVSLVAACGATYVSRFTVLDPRRTTESMAEALQHRGFAFVEVIAACPELYGRRNRLGDGLEMMRFYDRSAEVRHEPPTEAMDIAFQQRFVVGRFVQRQAPTYTDRERETLRAALGEAYRAAPEAAPARES